MGDGVGTILIRFAVLVAGCVSGYVATWDASEVAPCAPLGFFLGLTYGVAWVRGCSWYPWAPWTDPGRPRA